MIENVFIGWKLTNPLKLLLLQLIQKMPKTFKIIVLKFHRTFGASNLEFKGKLWKRRLFWLYTKMLNTKFYIFFFYRYFIRAFTGIHVITGRENWMFDKALFQKYWNTAVTWNYKLFSFPRISGYAFNNYERKL